MDLQAFLSAPSFYSNIFMVNISYNLLYHLFSPIAFIPLFPIYLLFILRQTLSARYYRPDTTLIGFPSINCFILSARIGTNPLYSRP